MLTRDEVRALIRLKQLSRSGSRTSEVKLGVDNRITVPARIREYLSSLGIGVGDYACYDFRSPTEIYVAFTKQPTDKTCRQIREGKYDWRITLPSPIANQILAVYGITRDDMRSRRAEIYIQYHQVDKTVFRLVHRCVKV